MQLEHARAIVKRLSDQGIPARVFPGYSGRGMYGAETAGVIAPRIQDISHAMEYLEIEDTCRSDSMGLDTVVS